MRQFFVGKFLRGDNPSDVTPMPEGEVYTKKRRKANNIEFLGVNCYKIFSFIDFLLDICRSWGYNGDAHVLKITILFYR
jgi:hypothetical protein